jgi:hypothetical protein
MAKSFLGPRKQRTRQHVIADQSVHHVEGFILDEGHTAQRVDRDYGYDASRKQAYWLAVQRHFRENVQRQPRKGAKSVRVHVPALPRVNRRAIAKIRDLKREAHGPDRGGES